MGQTYRKFKAATFDEAYRLMVRELGKNALVINTREVTEGGVFGLLGHRVIELTASAPEPAPATPEPQPLAVPRKRTLPEKKYAAAVAEHAAAVGGESFPAYCEQGGQVGSDETFGDTVDFFRKVVTEAQARIGKDVKPPSAVPVIASGASPRLRDAQSPAPVKPTPAMSIGGLLRSARNDERIESLHEEVREMRALLQVLVAEKPEGEFPPEFAASYRALVSGGACRKTAAALIAAAMEGSDIDILRDPRILAERVKIEIQKRIMVTGGIRLASGKRHTLALVGATGVGKTTNLAKLAAFFAVQHRARVALITTDTYRVAAPEQLRVYANIIGLPMMIANDAAELVKVLKSLEEYDLVLIDTVGGSQFNANQIRELQAILESARLDEVMLVLSASTQLEELRSAVTNFGALAPTSLLFSKLDETRHFGAMLTVAIECGLPLSYFSIGQNVPNDIELASAVKVASLVIVGGELFPAYNMEGGGPVGSGA